MVSRLKAALRRYRFVRAVWVLLVNLDRYAAAGVILHKLHSSSATTLGPLLKAFPPAVVQLIDGEFLRLSGAGFAVFAPVVTLAFAWVSSAGLSTALGVFECIYIGSERPWW